MEMQMLNTDMDYQVGNLLIKLANICDTIQVKPKLHLNWTGLELLKWRKLLKKIYSEIVIVWKFDETQD